MLATVFANPWRAYTSSPVRRRRRRAAENRRGALVLPARRRPGSPGTAIKETSPDQKNRPIMLTPVNALRILMRRTGGRISRATFYRWLSSGRVFSIRLGYRIYIPLEELELIIRQCHAGERF